MNREQRRATMHSRNAPAGGEKRLNFTYGHTGEKVLFQMTHKVDNILLSIPEAEQMIHSLQVCVDELRKHKTNG